MNSRIFPFAPGIPWQMAFGMYVIPKVKSSLLWSVLENKEIIVSCHGGLVETLASFAILEILNDQASDKKLFWNGNPKFHSLVKMQGLANIYHSLDQKTLDRYPVPLFMDATNKAIFNCLNNVTTVKNFYGEIGYKNRKNILSQIINNGLIDWRSRYSLILRNEQDYLVELENWSKINRFSFNQPFVCIIPEVTGYSHHTDKMALNWNPVQVKALGNMLSQKEKKLLVFTTSPEKYISQNVYILPPKLEHMMTIIDKAEVVLSKEFDYLIGGLLFKCPKLLSLPNYGYFYLKYNNKFLGEHSQVISLREEQMTPLEVFNVI